MWSTTALAQQRVGIGTLSPHPSAQLDLSSQDKGVLIPRMTSVQREMIPDPTNGLLVFDVTTTGFWYFDGVQWVQPFGPTGPQGPVGIVGVQGITGPTGPTGLPSTVIGPVGIDGITGAQGLQGPTGPTGIPGGIGIDGIGGVTGPQGLVGAAGPQGIDGVVGITGPIGNTGPQGPQGAAGIVGAQGIAGVTGVTGPMGPASFNTTIVLDAAGIVAVTDPQSTVSASQASWRTLGNSGTIPVTNFLGTTDNQDLKISTNSAERMRVLANGDVWVDGIKPFLLRRFFCNGCDNPNKNTGVSTADYVAFIAGYFPISDDGKCESTRYRMYSNGGTWWFKGDLESPSNENWSIDVLFIKLEMADDQRPASAQGGGTAF